MSIGLVELTPSVAAEMIKVKADGAGAEATRTVLQEDEIQFRRRTEQRGAGRRF